MSFQQILDNLFIYYYLPRIASSVILNCTNESPAFLEKHLQKKLAELAVISEGLTEGLNSESFDTKLNALTGRPQIHTAFNFIWYTRYSSFESSFQWFGDFYNTCRWKQRRVPAECGDIFFYHIILIFRNIDDVQATRRNTTAILSWNFFHHIRKWFKKNLRKTPNILPTFYGADWKRWLIKKRRRKLDSSSTNQKGRVKSTPLCKCAKAKKHALEHISLQSRVQCMFDCCTLAKHNFLCF